MELRWPDEIMNQSFNNFVEEEQLITYSEQEVRQPVTHPVEKEMDVTPTRTSKQAQLWEEYGKSWATGEPSELALQVFKIIGEAMGVADSPLLDEIITDMQSETKQRGQVPWEILTDFWAKAGETYKSQK